MQIFFVFVFRPLLPFASLPNSSLFFPGLKIFLSKEKEIPYIFLYVTANGKGEVHQQFMHSITLLRFLLLTTFPNLSNCHGWLLKNRCNFLLSPYSWWIKNTENSQEKVFLVFSRRHKDFTLNYCAFTNWPKIWSDFCPLSFIENYECLMLDSNCALLL